MLKTSIICPYCKANPSINHASFAFKDKSPAQLPENVRYACSFGHYFAVPRSSVEEKSV